MPLDHDIPTHLDVTDRPALGLTTTQLLLLAGGVLAGLGALRQPHVLLAIRVGEGIVPLGLALLLVVVRPSNRSLLQWGRVVLRHLTSHRAFTWTTDRGTASLPTVGTPIRRPPHLILSTRQPRGDEGDAGSASPSPQRSTPRPATWEQPFVPWDIADDMVTFRDGRRCAVLECSGTNTTLMSEDALRATHAAYHAALVGLPWPLQILVWASPVDLRAVTARRETRFTEMPLALRELESADIAFMRREAQRLGLLDHRLFVVIPASERSGTTVATDSLLTALRARLWPTPPIVSDNAVAAVLDERCERVMAELAAAGVSAWRLSTGSLRALWYRLLAPRSARLQPLDPGHAAPLLQPEITFVQAGEEDQNG